MTRTQVLQQLKTMGTAQNRKVYARHGVTGAMYGVSYANLGKLKKQIKVDHELAEQLWDTGNHDARVLATMIADPQRVTASQLEAWAKDLDNYVLTDALSSVIARGPLARKQVEKWGNARNEWKATAAWSVLASVAGMEGVFTDAELEAYLETAKSKIHGSANRVRHSMNNAVIAIGLRDAKLQKKAIAAAKHIGKVEVDHGETGCKTPDAVPYIEKAAARKRARAKA